MIGHLLITFSLITWFLFTGLVSRVGGEDNGHIENICVVNVNDDTILTLTFPEFVLTINRLQTPKHEIRQLTNDSVYVIPELIESVEGQLVVISQSLLRNMKIEQRYETSFQLSRDGPQCDLLHWQHGYSNWETLPVIAKNVFRFPRYQVTTLPFPAIDTLELKQIVKEKCGTSWSHWIDETERPDDFSMGVILTHYFIRVSGIHRATGKRVTKVITIKATIGC